jgi:transcriptional regulator with XRE-family HTH domain
MDALQAIAIRNKIIGVLVRRARLRAGKSQKDCAGFLGCSPFVFRQYEQGEKGLSLPELEALAFFFDVPPASLWDDSQPLPEDPAASALPMDQLLLLRRKILAVQFRQCRIAAGLAQREVAELLGCSPSMVSQYERGRRDIPLAELERMVEVCSRSLDEFLDQTIPLGQGEQERRALARLDELPADVRDFVLNPTNLLYFRIAILLSALRADNLRQIAETLLDITY